MQKGALMVKDNAIRLLLVEDRLEDAEQTISLLRNGGIAVRPHRPESEAELIAQLANQHVDIVLVPLSCKYLPFVVVVEHVNSTGKDIPILAITEALNATTILSSIAGGARNAVLRASSEHLQFVVNNEFASLDARRALRLLEVSLRETERRCDALISSSRDPIAYVHEGMHIRANEAYLEMFGFSSFDDVEGLSLLDLISPEHTDAFKQLLKKISKGEPSPKQFETRAQRIDGSSFDAIMEFAQATYEGEPCLQIIFRQQTLDANIAEELDALRQRDAATGLFNRQRFMSELELIIAKASTGQGQQALLLVELDNYEHIINEIGLGALDDLLAQISAHLQTALDSNTIAARFGDHIFAVLCTEHNHAATQQQAESIRASMEGHIFEVGQRSVGSTVSIGGVQIGEKIASVAQVLAKANHCLQSAVGVGGNGIEIFDPAARDRAEEERVQAWLQRIREALANDEFLLYYQPIISLNNDDTENYDVYVRMKAKNGEIVLPSILLSIADEHGLLEDIDRWVVSKAIANIAERIRMGKKTTLFVKITPASLTHSGFQEFLVAELKKHNLNGEHLVLQLPESKVYGHLRAVQGFQKAVSAFGIRLALEQFGTGLNSLQMLSHFDPAILKIDRSFILDLVKSTENQAKVKAIVEQARKTSRATIAEFVSDAATMSILFTMGVDYVEGNFLATAGPQMNYEFN